MSTRPARDRHGRGVRGPILPHSVPRWRTRAEAFDAAVVEAYAPIQEAFSEQLSNVDVAVDYIPRMQLGASIMPEEVAADGMVPLGRIIPAGVDHRGEPTLPRIVVFRSPIEQRCINQQERAALCRRVLTQLVATYLNVTPAMIDPRFDEDF